MVPVTKYVPIPNVPYNNQRKASSPNLVDFVGSYRTAFDDYPKVSAFSLNNCCSSGRWSGYISKVISVKQDINRILLDVTSSIYPSPSGRRSSSVVDRYLDSEWLANLGFGVYFYVLDRNPGVHLSPDCLDVNFRSYFGILPDYFGCLFSVGNELLLQGPLSCSVFQELVEGLAGLLQGSAGNVCRACYRSGSPLLRSGLSLHLTQSFIEGLFALCDRPFGEASLVGSNGRVNKQNHQRDFFNSILLLFEGMASLAVGFVIIGWGWRKVCYDGREWMGNIGILIVLGGGAFICLGTFVLFSLV